MGGRRKRTSGFLLLQKGTEQPVFLFGLPPNERTIGVGG